MKKRRSTSSIFLFVAIGLLLTLAGLTAAAYLATGETIVLSLGLGLMAAASVWLLILVYWLRRRLSRFTDDLCQTLDSMMNGRETMEKTPDDETLFSRLHTRLRRLYEVMAQNKNQVDSQRQDLQSLVSDISHQVKTPVSNLKMLTDTLLSKPVPEDERRLFLTGMRSQLDKLDFLFGAMVKSSRLETGLIRLERVQSRIYDTLAQALSGVMYDAEQKNIAVAVHCPEALQICHDSKWTAEALFNLLDNAVKYTPARGSITVAVEEWELHAKISVTDTGRGISEDQHAAVFRRFYREEAVHATPGVGIGLYLARDIITRQGGYIKLTSAVGQGSTFAVFLPKR